MRLMTKNEHIENGIIHASRKEFRGITLHHRHEFFEIEYIISGSGVCEINGREYPAEKNMIFFMTPADIHSFSAESCDMVNVMFSCESVSAENIFRLVSSRLNCIKLSSDQDIKLVEALLAETISCFESGNIENSLAFTSVLTVKLASFSSEENTDNLLGGDIKLPSDICKVMLYLLENFREGVSLGDAAEYVGFSSSYLSSEFRKYTGQTFKNYLNSLQFDYASRLLAFSDKNVQQICYESGFSDYSNFERRFRNRFGCSPKEYRARHIQL